MVMLIFDNKYGLVFQPIMLLLDYVRRTAMKALMAEKMDDNSKRQETRLGCVRKLLVRQLFDKVYQHIKH